MDKPNNASDAQITAWVGDLVENGVVAEDLYELLCKLAYVLLGRRLLTADKVILPEEAHSLAIEMILHIRTKRLDYLRCAAHLDREMRKYLTRRESPAHHEVWTTLSQALLELEGNGLATRPATAGGSNGQTTEWCRKGNEGKPDVQQHEFFEAESRLTLYLPPRKDGRLLSPSQAKELALRLLEVADGPILMQTLHAEAMKHVVQSMEYAESLDRGDAAGGDEDSPTPRALADRMPILGYMLEEESIERAASLWNELEGSGDGQTLCLYYLPKHLLGKSVKGSELGDFRRVSEGCQRIRNAFRRTLDLTPTLNERQAVAAADRLDPSGTGLPGAQARLLGRIAELLMQFCSEKSWDAHLKPTEDEP